MSNIRKAKVDDALIISQISVDTWKKTYEGILPNEYMLAPNIREPVSDKPL